VVANLFEQNLILLINQVQHPVLSKLITNYPTSANQKGVSGPNYALMINVRSSNGNT
jgi:hypothetical protein